MTLPSKKILPTLAASLVVAAGITAAAFYNPAPTPVSSQTKQLSLTSVSPISPDLDTSLSASSTNQTSELAATVASDLTATGTPPLTVTQKLAEDIFGQYMMAKEDGGQLSDSDEAQIIQSALQADTPSLNTQTYSEADIVVSTDSSATAIKNYGNAVGVAISNNDVPLSDDELLILGQAMDDNSQSELTKINTIVSAYKNMIAVLLETPTPQTAVNFQLALVNGLSELIQSDQNIESMFSDPTLSLVGLQQYEQAAGDVMTAFSNMGQYFQNNGVSFQVNEPGYFITILHS